MKKSTFNTPACRWRFSAWHGRHQAAYQRSGQNARAGHCVRHAHQERLPDMVEQAKANVDDMVAEAAYITQSEAAADGAAE